MAPPTADRNLLFGILALQLDFINREQLIQAMHAWVLTKHRPLGDILAEQGALAVDNRALLEALVQKHLALHNNDPRESLAAVSSIKSAGDELRQIGDADVQASLAHVAADSKAADPYATKSRADTAALPGLRYRILRQHARGGLGEVYVAEDTELHREIALKEIQARHADDTGSRGRFLMEAEVTGGLEHPGIVPVYGLGTYADGRPFYAMRFIRGDNLKEAITTFHRTSAGATDYQSAPFRQLLGRFIDVCNAVAYAHSRGVLHRDLKPGNVMLGKFGETLVVDWGLAKVVGRGAAGERSEENTLRLSSGSGVAETAAGSAIGTPAYMSPEQASGKIADLGPATDVYSLGATLYTLLTNRVPVSGDVAEVLRKVQRGKTGFSEPGAPAIGAHVGPGTLATGSKSPPIPRPLVAICKKAMALHPRNRYATPLDLAEDLEHWLADEPVSAAREPILLRARRWMRKHPGVVSGAAAAVLVAVVGLAIGAVMLGEKNHELSKVNESLTAANTNLNKANALIESIFRDIDPHATAKGGPLLIEQLTRRVLEAADKLDENAIGDPLAVARLQSILGNTLNGLGEANKAIELHSRARGVREKLLGAQHPDTLNSMNNLGLAYQQAGKLDLALPLCMETVKVSKAKFGPDHPATLATINNLANAYAAAGKLHLALPLHEEAFKLSKTKLGPNHPDTLRSMTNLALGYHDAGKPDRALPLFEDSFRRLKAELGRDHPDTLNSMNSLAVAYHAAGKLDLALPLYEETFMLTEAKLGHNHPATHTTMSNLAGCYQAAGKLDLALPLYEEALKLTKAKLGHNHPATLTTMHNLASAYQGAGKLDLALPLYEETLKLIKAKLGPDHFGTLITIFNLAKAYLDTNQPDKAVHAFDEYMAVKRMQHGADDPRLTSPLTRFALDLLQRRHFTAAERLLREALAIRVKTQPDEWSTFDCKAMLGASLLGQNKHQEAEPLLIDGYEGMKAREKAVPPFAYIRLLETSERLVQLYKATDRKGNAGKWLGIVADLRHLEGRFLEPIHDAEKDLELTGQLDAEAPALIYQVRLKAGVSYTFDMADTDNRVLNPYLFLRDDKGETLAENDDFGGTLNARIVYRPRAGGVYQVRATSFNNGRGEFTLRVRRH